MPNDPINSVNLGEPVSAYRDKRGSWQAVDGPIKLLKVLSSLIRHNLSYRSGLLSAWDPPTARGGNKVVQFTWNWIFTGATLSYSVPRPVAEDQRRAVSHLGQPTHRGVTLAIKIFPMTQSHNVSIQNICRSVFLRNSCLMRVFAMPQIS